MTAAPIGPAGPAADRRQDRGGFWVVALVFTAVMAYSTLPTPLYPLYEAADGFPASVVTLVFAVYAVGVLVSLYLAGHVSDWIGRRPVMLTAVALQVVAALVFVLWTALPGLLVARFVNGIGVGILTATATAWLSELRRGARPQESPVFAGSIATAANLGGLGLGPVIGGLFARFAPDPLHLPHLVFLGLFALSFLAVRPLPETAPIPRVRPRWRPQRVAVPRSSRPVFLAAGAAAFSAFAVFGMFGSIVPTFLATTLHESNAFVAGGVAGSVFLAACVSQLVLGRSGRVLQVRVLLGMLVIGLLVLGGGALAASLPVFAAGGVVAGAGVGLLFRNALTTAATLGPPEAKGEGLAAIFLIAYAGLCLPVLAIGVALAFVPELVVVLVFVAIVLIAVTASGLALLAHFTRERDAH